MHNVSILDNLHFSFTLERIPESNDIQSQCYSNNRIMLKVEVVLFPEDLGLMQ